MRDLERTLYLLLGLTRQSRYESHLDTTLQYIELAEVLPVVAYIRAIQLDQAIGDHANTIAYHALACLDSIMVCLIMCADGLTVGVEHVLFQQNVGVQSFGAVTESLCYFI